MTTNVEETKTEEQTREYGLTLMVKQDGSIQITPHNVQNDFETVGLIEYLNQKKSDLLKTIGLSLEARTLHSIGLLSKALVATAGQTQESAPQG